jgi:hypothetical protein
LETKGDSEVWKKRNVQRVSGYSSEIRAVSLHLELQAIDFAEFALNNWVEASPRKCRFTFLIFRSVERLLTKRKV